MLVGLAGGTVGLPLRAIAQEAKPAASAPPAGVSQSLQTEVSPGQVKKEEQEEHTVYLHTPLVASIGRALHLSVETTANLFLVINFAIIALAIVIPVAKVLPKVMRKRAITLSHNLETARKATDDANARLTAVEAQLSRLDEEISKFRAQVEEESLHDEARIKAAIEEERTRIVAAAEQEISVAAAQAKRGLRHFAADLAIEKAARQLMLTPETDRALIAEFVSETSQNGLTDGKTRGGRN